MKKHFTILRYFSIYNDDVDLRLGEVTHVPRKDEVVFIETKRGVQTYRVEQVVWAVGKKTSEAQVRLVPWMGEKL